MKIAYKVLYLFSGMLLLMAIALTLAAQPSWKYWIFGLLVFILANDIDNGTKAPPR